MRRSLIAVATLTLIGSAGIGAARAGQGYEPVQYYAPYGAPAWQQGSGWEHRMAWREHRRQEDEARIQDAARREAWRIQQEREQRRVWWHAQREQGHGGGYYRSW